MHKNKESIKFASTIIIENLGVPENTHTHTWTGEYCCAKSQRKNILDHAWLHVNNE